MKQAIKWFKDQFSEIINNKISGTPFSIDILIAIVMQETYYVWAGLYKTLSVSELLKICVGDTIDYPGRKAFPRKKEILLAVENGEEMFNIAREAFGMVAQYNSSYKRVYDNFPNKFCHGFGIFQYDLQFFKSNPDFFLNKKWYSFENCLDLFIQEMNAALIRAYGAGKENLTDIEKVYVAIAYNKGSVNFNKGFKQGYKDSDGIYYGEHIWEYLKLSKSVPE